MLNSTSSELMLLNNTGRLDLAGGLQINNIGGFEFSTFTVYSRWNETNLATFQRWDSETGYSILANPTNLVLETNGNATDIGKTMKTKGIGDFRVENTVFNTRFIIKGNNGNVGIGTTDTTGYKLNVDGSLNDTQIFINGTVISSGISFWVAGVSSGIFYSGGRVGICSIGTNNRIRIISSRGWIINNFPQPFIITRCRN